MTPRGSASALHSLARGPWLGQDPGCRINSNQSSGSRVELRRPDGFLPSVVQLAGGLLVGRSCPAGEQAQRLVALRADFGREREHHEAGVGRERHPFVAELEAADERVLESLEAGV